MQARQTFDCFKSDKTIGDGVHGVTSPPPKKKMWSRVYINIDAPTKFLRGMFSNTAIINL